ncbi:DUF2500 domain-containing protein [Texcoconibacillus texcoconensis]|uniref:DUF2500 domain-containing protein n=1 Tax=Texcoconibacillus texcoconensis TaxID=1095777 RepID=A0A840QMI6_9BACI|nr:DUF2500 domain-containing protein [Texcoconibacillus texcoconensis]MBB5172595.1 hypothetical protein [Texcoconibacillus texcoconensis]
MQLFEIITFIVPVIFMIILGFTLFSMVRSLLEWIENNNKAVQTDKAKVTSKRADVQKRRTGKVGQQRVGGVNVGGVNVGGVRTRGVQLGPNHKTKYFVTFEFENGDRHEFKVKGNEYGMLTEGDVGHITFQGTRYKGFERVGTV